MLRFRYRSVIFLMIAGLMISPWSAVYVAAASPLLAGAALPAGQATVVQLLALFPTVACFVKRRFFCHTLCPLGFCFDVIGKVRKKTGGSNRLPRFLRAFPKIGIFLALLTLLGGVLGVVGFLWLDPLILFESLFRSNRFLLPVLVTLFVSAWFAPTFYCRRICPLGGMQDLLFAPKSLMSTTKTAARTAGRRTLLRRGVLFVLFGGVFEILRRRTGACAASEPLRPPGAVPEPFFLALCTRCGSCAQSCPTGLLTTQVRGGSPLDSGTPHLSFDPAWCRDDCTACTRVCPSGALRPSVLEEKRAVKIGLAEFEFEYCRLYEDIECSICGRDCPFDAISFQWSEEEYRRVVQIDQEKCTGCGRCIVACPVKDPRRPLNIGKSRTRVASPFALSDP